MRLIIYVSKYSVCLASLHIYLLMNYPPRSSLSSNYNRASHASVRVCENQLLERLMSPSPKSQFMFGSAFS